MKEICNQVDYLSEAIGLLTHIASGESYMELKRSLETKRNIAFESKGHVFEVLTRIEKAAQKTFEKNKESLGYYFKVEEKAVRSCGEVLILWDGFGNEPYRTIEELEKNFENATEEEYVKQFGNYLQCYGDSICDESTLEKFSEPIQVITYLMNMEISQEEKWKLQTVFLNRREHYSKVFGMIGQTMELLKQFEDELNGLVQEFYDYWNEELAESSLIEYMQKRMELNVPVNPYGFRLRPSIMIPNVAGIHIDPEEDGTYKKQDEGWIGIVFGPECDILVTKKEEELEAAQVLRALKLLSDKSKFDILCRISKESAYGNQLAKEMNLTAATISHHVNTLMTEGLVTIRLEDKKVYYEPDKENLRKILERSKELLGL